MWSRVGNWLTRGVGRCGRCSAGQAWDGIHIGSLESNRGQAVASRHTAARKLPAIRVEAEILVAAIGRAGFVSGEHIRDGAAVVDVGINRVSDADAARIFFEGEELEKRLKAIENRGSTLVGDVNPKDAMAKAAYFTPVPGGVGLLTVAMLMKNAVTAAKIRRGI